MKKSILAFAMLVLANTMMAKNIQIYESPGCGCCELWADYMKNKGFEVSIHKTDDLIKIKEKLGIKDGYQSCHTGVIETYVVEGHVPYSAVAWLLANKPKDVIGIAAPGMPQGSPGMEQGYVQKYPVILMKKDGNYELYGYFIGEKKL
ncbi:DUF411 domain-containing protein [Campylobacter sp. VicNov18]|uniref:DUF411 domain-containing protein n=1 Tax=Campylobacter bilis TaxID=2691918 RepID=UPI00130DD0CB|nr:DUF411 domain-containing protein [Campylobacter bilis]MPV63735.1 DUF411 domain-containing protein [Campylobacter hepaticus]MBM0637236.1 DUF411 domain-containing protein [Campylobacter bilis]MCC8277955.1 DUF411 domain-containing protein [Campylobacter bilis]MCC8299459.1 DUF411 domain-containing protein [Campylobacter bilis]MCC8300864.1 DUF411 domain-containing protein [Campylobacter bilis]